jgi:hypothetical protein
LSGCPTSNVAVDRQPRGGGDEPPLDAGIVVDLSRGTLILGNDLDQNDPALIDVHLSATTHEVRVIGLGDRVLNEGMDNDVN